ncbi:tetratricopeptide repeat protein [Nocardiopsis chromatogenes]|uniref:tetratricopeptide repeat protein n=1 Tax=Nocardiopsis chromatogenes TaxID=280239 RepID=UPI000345B8F9|nr:tetratricopeptide repeat protein [Nocardiopsis chromatogenes]
MPPTVLSDLPPGPEDVEPAVESLLDVVEPLALAADRRLNPNRWVLSPRYENITNAFASTQDALHWYDANAGLVRACVRIAYETGRNELAWTLCEGMWAWLHIRKPWHTWRLTHEVGLEAAKQCDAAPQARMYSALGALHMWQDRLDEAERLHVRARALWIAAEHLLGQASGLESLGVIALKRGHPVTARGHFREAQHLFSEQGRERGVVLMERRLGESFRDTGDHATAEEYLRGALDWFRAAGEDYPVVRTSRSLALALQAQGRQKEAQGVLAQARDLAESIGADTDAAELSCLMQG